jgi:aminopeptidase N
MTKSNPFRFFILSATACKILFVSSVLMFLGACSSSRNTTSTGGVEPDQKPKPAGDPAVYRASATRSFDLLHTCLRVTFDWQNRQMPGTAEISLKPHFYPASMLYLDARGMTINEVKLVKGSSQEEVAYEYRNDSICITLDRTYTRHDTLIVFIDYVARPEDLPKGGSAAITSDKGLYFINADGSDPLKPQQVWTQGETQSSSVWFPTIDRPNQKTTQEIYITVDTAFVTLSNGVLLSSLVNASTGTRTDYWKQSLPHAPYLFMMAVGKYAIVKDKWRDREVSYYVEPEYAPYARDIFGNTPEMMHFFSRILGVDYPWEKYAQVVVRDYVSGAMENTTATIFGEFMQKDRRGLLDGTNEDVISHELIHHWFGDLVTCESWANLPLNESFATYGEYLWNEHKYGRDEADYNIQNDLNNYLRESRSKQVDMIRFDYKLRDDMFDSHSYAKGGRILHMLRKYTGDEAFFTSLNRYLVANLFDAAEMHHLRLAFEEVTGEDLNWFFNQWFYDKGHPSLKIDYGYDSTASMQYIYVQQVQDSETTPLYRLPVDADFYTKTGVIRKRIEITRKEEKFAFPFEEKPLLVNFDAQKSLLCVKTDNHSREEWVYMYQNAPRYLDRFESLSKITKSYSAGTPEATVVRDALSDQHWNLRVMAVKNARTLAVADPEGMKKQIMTMASGDPKSDVRMESLELLMELFPGDPEVDHLMKSAVADSSYIVMETALEYFLVHSPSEGLALINGFETDPNENIREMAVGFYVDYGSDAQYDFMKTELDHAAGYSRYSAVLSFGKFLMRCSPSVAMKGLVPVSDIATGDPQWFVRLSAVQALSEIASSFGRKTLKNTETLPPVPADAEAKAKLDSECEQVRTRAETLLTTAKEKETDPNLLRIYRKEP